MGNDICIAFLDGLFSTLWFGKVDSRIFETGEFTVYCDVGCLSRISGRIMGTNFIADSI